MASSHATGHQQENAVYKGIYTFDSTQLTTPHTNAGGEVPGHLGGEAQVGDQGEPQVPAVRVRVGLTPALSSPAG